MSFKLSDIHTVFFDADDTLFTLRSSIGEIYREVAKPFGVDFDADHLNEIVLDVWLSVRPEYLNEHEDYRTSPEHEKEFWLSFVDKFIGKFSKDPELHLALYDEFAFARSRVLLDGVENCLDFLDKQGVKIGIISNNDDRITSVVDDMGLSHRFSHILPTTSLGYKKPSKNCYDLASQRVGVEPSKLLYVGDNIELDYHGARGAGWTSILMNWRERDLDSSILSVNSYAQLLELFKRH